MLDSDWFRDPEQRVKDIAKAKGLTIKDLCAKASIDPSTVRYWKNGKHEPRLDIIKRFELLNKNLADDLKPRKEKKRKATREWEGEGQGDGIRPSSSEI